MCFELYRERNACDCSKDVTSHRLTVMASPYAAEPPNPIPKYVYEITTEPPPKLDSHAGDHLPLSALDAQDGFIHLSTGARVPVTAGLFFRSLQKIWVLKISVDSSEC